MTADNNSEWLTHQHRDTAAAIVGHPPLLAYISIADGECQARERFEVIEVSYQGPGADSRESLKCWM